MKIRQYENTLFGATDKALWFTCVFAAAIFALHATTLLWYPECWLDEVTIREYGVAAMGGRPLAGEQHALFYGAGLLSNALFEASGSAWPNRVASLMGLPLMTLLMFAWLRKRFSGVVSAACACLFCVDALVLVGAKWGRPDLLGMSLVMAAVLSVGNTGGWRGATVAGALCGAAFTWWPATVVLMPLVAAETAASRGFGRKLATAAACGALGFAIFQTVSIVALLATGTELQRLLQQTVSMTELKDYLSPEATVNVTWAAVTSRARLFLSLILRSPITLLLTVVGVGVSVRRRGWHVGGLAISAAVVLSSHVYHARVSYLAPFMFLFVTEAMSVAWGRKAAWAGMAYGVALALAINCCAVPRHGDVLPSDLIRELRGSGIGRGASVGITEYGVHDAGKKLGWVMTSTLPADGYALLTPETLAGLDAVVTAGSVPESAKSALESAGFALLLKTKASPYTRWREIFYARGNAAYAVWVGGARIK